VQELLCNVAFSREKCLYSSKFAIVCILQSKKLILIFYGVLENNIIVIIKCNCLEIFFTAVG